MSSLEKDNSKSRGSRVLPRSSFIQSTISSLGILDSQEIKAPPILSIQELAQKYLPKGILKEKQMNLSERRVIWEKQAQIEDKERTEREKKARFNERDFDFNGEQKLDELVPPKFELWNQSNITCKSARNIMETIKMKGFANLPLDFKTFFNIKEENLVVSKEKSLYLSFKTTKKRNPHLFKFARKTRFRELKETIKSYYELDSESILTTNENIKRGEIFAKLYMKLNLQEILEKIKKEEEEAVATAANMRMFKELENLKALTETSEDNKVLKIIDEDEEDSEYPEEEKKENDDVDKKLIEIMEGKTAKEMNEKIRELFANKQISLVGMSGDNLKRIMFINENYEEIIEYFDQKILETFERDNIEECVYLKAKKEEFVQSLKNYNDYESLLRTLIIYKLNNNI